MIINVSNVVKRTNKKNTNSC